VSTFLQSSSRFSTHSLSRKLVACQSSSAVWSKDCTQHVVAPDSASRSIWSHREVVEPFEDFLRLFFRCPNYLPSNPVKKHSPTEWCRNNSPRRAVALREDGPSCGLWPARKHAADCIPKLGLFAGVDTNEYVPLELLIFERPPLVTQLHAASLTIKYHASRCSLLWSSWDMLYETKSTVPRIKIRTVIGRQTRDLM